MQTIYSTTPANWDLVRGVLPFCRDAVEVFNSPANWTTLVRREDYPSAEMQLVYSTALDDRARVGEVLTVCIDAVGVFYSLNTMLQSNTLTAMETPRLGQE